MIFYQTLSTYSLKKSIEISLENLFVDIGAKRIIKITNKKVNQSCFLSLRLSVPITTNA